MKAYYLLVPLVLLLVACKEEYVRFETSVSIESSKSRLILQEVGFRVDGPTNKRAIFRSSDGLDDTVTFHTASGLGNSISGPYCVVGDTVTFACSGSHPEQWFQAGDEKLLVRFDSEYLQAFEKKFYREYYDSTQLSSFWPRYYEYMDSLGFIVQK